MSRLDIIAFDADDTLWHNLIHYNEAEKAFGNMFSHVLPPEDGARRLAQAEQRNIGLYGYGVKSFTLSMIETAIEITGGTVDAATISKLIKMGRTMLDHGIELLPHVSETLEKLHASHRLLLITKGDLHHQERKVLASGLAHFFEGVEIVSDKKPETYRRLCARHGGRVANTLMAGNSVRSDVLPMIEAGGYGVYVPFDILWEHEHEDVPADTPRFFAVDDIRGVADVVARLGSE
ncbi:MAG: HAD family hydrolase [Rhizobiales bacterium]|nr:HAD family hydrolase [Hyphomicrobiales bacterium]